MPLRGDHLALSGRCRRRPQDGNRGTVDEPYRNVAAADYDPLDELLDQLEVGFWLIICRSKPLNCRIDLRTIVSISGAAI
jgi:hypothetical protein